jgi:hypothetical protein
MAKERKDRLLVGCLWAVAAAVVLAIGNVWYFLSNFSWTKGRPLRGRSERKPHVSFEKSESREDVAAHHWQDMAQEEYESIAAFSEVALDLMAAGAPVELVIRCHQAALEEAKHTQTCLDRTGRGDLTETSRSESGVEERARLVQDPAAISKLIQELGLTRREMELGAAWRAELEQASPEQRSALFEFRHFDVDATELDGARSVWALIAQLRSATRDLAYPMCVERLLKRIFVTLASRDGSERLGDLHVNEMSFGFFHGRRPSFESQALGNPRNRAERHGQLLVTQRRVASAG